MAEKAFSLLQDALKESETRVSELDAELKKRRAPKNQSEQQAMVLAHRLESLEAERDHWKREAGQLEEIVENERVKSQQLKKRVEIAESGPDKLDKKEVNFWRSRAEQFDAETKEYKRRIAELKNSLKESAKPEPMADPHELNRMLATDGKAAEANAQAANLSSLVEVLRGQISQLHSVIGSLETELNEERECTVNLSEIANERREQITELAEKLDETNERYQEAEWKLERANRFERLVAKRRKLIDSLLEALRAKRRSNVALKAGLDGLRRFKAKSEKQQQKLLVRLDELQGRLSAAKDEHKAAEGLTGELAEIKARLAARDETIDGLESEIATLQAKLAEEQELAQGQSQDTAAESRKRESEIADLKRTIKDRDKEVARLNEAVVGWQKKYEFVATETPAAYQPTTTQK